MTWPACAKAPSISPATEESRPENTSFGARPGVAASTPSVATSSGRRAGRRHAVASRYAFPAEPRDLEPWMVREQRDELLADHAGRAEDSNFDRHRSSPL